MAMVDMGMDMHIHDIHGHVQHRSHQLHLPHEPDWHGEHEVFYESMLIAKLHIQPTRSPLAGCTGMQACRILITGERAPPASAPPPDSVGVLCSLSKVVCEGE